MELLKVYLTNLGKYNEGTLQGEWLTLPCTEEEIADAMKRIQVEDNTEYEEYFITDYESDYNIECDEYTNIYKLNEDLQELESALQRSGEDAEIIQDFNDADVDWDEVANRLQRGDYTFYKNYTMEDVAEELISDCYEIPSGLENYIDYESFARDLEFDGYTETTNGVMYLE